MKKVVIVGGGFAGSTVAKKLEKDFDVSLIDSKNYFEFTPGILRTIISPSHARKIQAFHKDYLKKAVFIRGTVTSIDKRNVFVKNKKFPYDYLLICSGSKYVSPIKEQNIILAHHMKNLADKSKEIENSKKILIIGGGLVGVELAGEICTGFAGKEVTIIQAMNRLLERNPSHASEYARKFLEKKGVRIIFSEFFKGKKEDYYITDKGTKINADMLFPCTGTQPNSEFMLKNFRGALDEKKRIIVDKFLRLENSRNIFVAGDVNSLPIEKTAQNAILQAEAAVKNIKALENNKELKQDNPRATPLVISLGKWKGMFVWKSFVLAGWIPGIMKHIIEWWHMKDFK